MNFIRSALMGLALLTCVFATSARAEPDGVPSPNERNIVRISFSPGGSVFEFIERYLELRRKGSLIVIDGMCISACTLIIALIDNDHVCVTERARMVFHSATIGGQHSSEGTRLVWHMYPQAVRAWLRQHGWDGGQYIRNEHPELIYMEGDDLRQFYRDCTAQEEQDAAVEPAA